MGNSKPVSTLANEDIILISNQMWEDRYWTSKQYIAKELKDSNRVLYVEANYSFGKLFLGLIRGSWPVRPFGKLTQLENNFWILTPTPRLPLRNHLRLIGWLNQYLLKWKIRSALKKIEFHSPILWTFLHQTADLVGAFDEKVALYHCVDDWPALIPMAKMGLPKVVRKDEDKLLGEVNLIFRVSNKLLEGRGNIDTPMFDIPNGVDASLFKPMRISDLKHLDDLDMIRKPIIGFSGSIGAWIDVELIEKVADRYPHCSVVLIGLNEKNPRVGELIKKENVFFLGMKKREDVPHYLSKFDVCLMPFNKGKVGEGLLPLKMFEYLALGKPVVTISSETMEIFRDVLFCADDGFQFLDMVEMALNDNSQELIDKRVHRAQSYNWPSRIERYHEAILKIIS